MRNLLVCGTRTIDDAESIQDAIEAYLIESGDEITFVTVGAKGVDSIAAEYASSHGYPVKEFLLNWKKYGRAAGPHRNKEMVDYLPPAISSWRFGTEKVKERSPLSISPATEESKLASTLAPSRIFLKAFKSTESRTMRSLLLQSKPSHTGWSKCI